MKIFKSYKIKPITISLMKCIVYKNNIMWIILSLRKFLEKIGGVTNNSAENLIFLDGIF
jgi:hypothetical protein